MNITNFIFKFYLFFYLTALIMSSSIHKLGETFFRVMYFLFTKYREKSLQAYAPSFSKRRNLVVVFANMN